MAMKVEDLPVLHGDEAREIDLKVTKAVGRVRVLEAVATRIADTLHYHLLDDDDVDDSSKSGSNSNAAILPPYTTPLLFVAGKGNNGANAIAAARLLHFRGYTNIHVVTLVDPSQNDAVTLRPNMKEQIDLFNELVVTAPSVDGSSSSKKIHPLDFDRIRNHAGILIDGVLGTGISDPPRGVSATAIEAMNSASKAAKVLSIDIPSGLNHISGEAPGVCTRATWTINLHMLKSGQLAKVAKPYIGELWSAETSLGFVTFPNLTQKFQTLYKNGPIQKIELSDDSGDE